MVILCVAFVSVGYSRKNSQYQLSIAIIINEHNDHSKAFSQSVHNKEKTTKIIIITIEIVEIIRH